MPAYSETLRQAGATGLVTIGVSIDKTGKLVNAYLKDGDGRLWEISMKALRQWRWKPYIVNGEATDVVSTVVFEYKADTGEVLINPALPATIDIRRALNAGVHP